MSRMSDCPSDATGPSVQRGLIGHSEPGCVGNNDFTSEGHPARSLSSRPDQERPGSGRNVLKRVCRLHLVLAAVSVIIITFLLLWLVVVHIRWAEDQKILKDCVQSIGAETGKDSEVLPPCDYGWIWYRNKCFQFSDNAGGWTEAKDSCAALNSSLAMIYTQKELEFLQRHKGDPDLWIGLSRRDRNHPWIWVDGTKFNNWFTVEDYEECAYLSRHTVRSSDCYNYQQWICSKYPLKKAQ